MCLESRKQFLSTDGTSSIIEAYKIFGVVNGKLISAFRTAYYPNLWYEPWKLIDNLYYGTFFAFKNFNEAMQVVSEDNIWNWTYNVRIVLPVFLYDVKYTGYFDCSYECYESKSILVKDNLENRKKFDVALIKKRIGRLSRLKEIERESLTRLTGIDFLTK